MIEPLLFFLGIVLVVVLLAIPIITFISASRITKLEHKIKNLEGRIQQQGFTLKALYEQVQRDHVKQDVNDMSVHAQIHEKSNECAHLSEEAAPLHAHLKQEQIQKVVDDDAPEKQGTIQSASLQSSSSIAVTACVADGKTDLMVDESGVEIAASKDVKQPLQGMQSQNNDPHSSSVVKGNVLSSQVEDEDVETVEEKEYQYTKAREQEKRNKAQRLKRSNTEVPSLDSLFNKLISYATQWLKTGNVPVKVGVLVLFAGIVSLFRYATLQGWVYVPIEAKLGIVAGLSAGAFIFAWRKRVLHRTFSLSIQGGSIGILLLTVFAAYKLFDVLPAGIAFTISIALIAFTCLLALQQNAMVLAIFAVLAGFLAPIWLSSGSGNYVALFSYYAILNAAIFAMSWYRPWRELNLLGFIFTFGIGAAWGVKSYIPDNFATTEPFLLLFFAFYLLIPIFYARKYKGDLRNKVDAALVFGTPLIGFSLQAALLQDNRYALAGCAFGLGLIYFALRYFLSSKEQLKAFVPAYLALGVGFITLAIPLAFSAQKTSCIYALEGAVLVWWGIRRTRILSSLMGMALQGLAAFAFMFTLDTSYHVTEGWPILNANYINLVILAVSAFFSAWCGCDKNASVLEKALKMKVGGEFSIAPLFYIWGLIWWCGAVTNEVIIYSSSGQYGMLIGAGAITAWAASKVYNLRPEYKKQVLSLTVVLFLGIGVALNFWANNTDAHLLSNVSNALGWFVFAVLTWFALRNIKDCRANTAQVAQVLWWVWVGISASMELHWVCINVMELSPASAWYQGAMVLPWLVLLAAIIWKWEVIRAPIGSVFDGWQSYLIEVMLVIGSVVWVAALLLPANTSPLPWLPILNPIELLQLCFAGILFYELLYSKRDYEKWYSQQQKMFMLAIVIFLMLSVMVLRGIHHWGGIAWGDSLIRSNLSQTALSILWSILGVSAWIWGSKKGRRLIWLAGAVLMTLVLAKLILIDRQELGNVLGIVSFIGYGLMCVVVGYFAPAPPKEILKKLNSDKG